MKRVKGVERRKSRDAYSLIHVILSDGSKGKFG